MKEPYLTQSNISAKAKAWLDYARASTQIRGGKFSLKDACLLVLDLQRYFLEPSSHAFAPSAPLILPQVEKLIAMFRKASCPVLFTRHGNTTGNAGMMAVWWNDLIKPGNPSHELYERLDSRHDEVIEKAQYDAFYGTDLEERLRRMGSTQLIICGLLTHLCVETTVRSAFCRGFRIYLPVDGTATYNEAFHRASLLNLGHGFARLTTVEELCRESD